MHLQFRRLSPPIASAHAIATAFVKDLAMRPPAAWTELDAQSALEAATRVLHVDLANNTPVMGLDLAKRLARRFLACCAQPRASRTCRPGRN